MLWLHRLFKIILLSVNQILFSSCWLYGCVLPCFAWVTNIDVLQNIIINLMLFSSFSRCRWYHYFVELGTGHIRSRMLNHLLLLWLYFLWRHRNQLILLITKVVSAFVVDWIIIIIIYEPVMLLINPPVQLSPPFLMNTVINCVILKLPLRILLEHILFFNSFFQKFSMRFDKVLR